MKILVLLPACPLMTCSNVGTKIRVSVCRGVWVYSPTRVHVKTGSQRQASSSTALLLFFKTAALIELGDHPCCQTDWPGPLGDPLVFVPPPSTGVTGTCHQALFFIWMLGRATWVRVLAKQALHALSRVPTCTTFCAGRCNRQRAIHADVSVISTDNERGLKKPRDLPKCLQQGSG